ARSGSSAEIFFTGRCSSTRCSPRGPCWGTATTVARSLACTCVGPERILAVASLALRDTTRPARSLPTSGAAACGDSRGAEAPGQPPSPPPPTARVPARSVHSLPSFIRARDDGYVTLSSRSRHCDGQWIGAPQHCTLSDQEARRVP